MTREAQDHREGAAVSLLDQVRAARQAHEALRSSQPAPANLDEKAGLYRAVKAALDELWAAADRPGVAAPAVEVRRAVRRLTVDAEYHAGLTDGEGFRDPAEVWGQYEWLERAFAGNP
jgi:hypothetical protein